MKINNLNTLKVLLISLLAFIACNNDDEATLIEANHRVIVTSEKDYNNTINIGGHIDFGDISSGVASRTWTFPEGVSYIAGTDKNTSSKDVVKGFFTAPGQYDVTLHQVFKGNVYPNEDSTVPNAGKELDTTIVVTVLGAVKASIKAHYINDDGSNGAELTLADNAENEIIASKSVRLSYTTEGTPTSFVWNLDGGKPATVADATAETDVKYSKLGSWDLQFIASRARPFGGDTISVKNFIKVIPSTEPVTLDKVTNKDGKIALEFSREMDPATLNKSNFSVKIETKSGAMITPIIQKAEVDETEGNIVLLTLDSESIYNDDIIKVSYVPGNLMTSDAVASAAFTDIELEFNKVNILKGIAFDQSFENSTAANWPFNWWNNKVYDLTISTDKAQDGNRSAYIELYENSELPDGTGQWMWLNHKNDAGANNTVYFEAGKTYEIGMWVYLVDRGNPTGFDPDIRFYWDGPFDWGTSSAVVFTSDFPTGQWVYRKMYYSNFPTSKEYILHMRAWNPTNSQRVKYYMDNIMIAEVNLRP